MKNFFLLMLWSFPLCADINLIDDEGTRLHLSEPAHRVIVLAPHVAENLYAIGAGNSIIAAVEYSDYPIEAKKLPRVGRFNTFDIEAIVSLRPDLVIAWGSGNGSKIIATLRGLGIPVYVDEPTTLTGISHSLRQYGQLVGKSNDAEITAKAFDADVQKLRAQYADKRTVKVFYQIWHNPIQTINNAHVIGRVIDMCGGVNVFADAVALAPTINIETILARNPQVIIASGEDERPPVWLGEWQRWPTVEAVSQERIYALDPNLIQRHTPRILQGAAKMCELIDAAR